MIYKKEVILVVVLMSALMSPLNAYSAVLINEILANGIVEPDSEWVELYNNESSDADLTNFNISESNSKNLTLNAIIPSNSFIVLVENFTLFNATFPNVNESGIKIVEYGELVPNFELSNTRGNVTLYDSSGIKIDNIGYVQSTSQENISIARYPDGSPNIFNLSTMTPGAKNDAQAPKLNKWLNPSSNNTKIAGVANISVNITDDTTQVTAIINFNGTNFSMTKNNDLFIFLWNTSLNAQKSYNITVFFNDSYGKNGNDALFNITIKNPNRAPIINITIDNITVSETQKVNITINASDSDNDTLSFNINDSSFSLSGIYYVWNTNLSDSGTYTVNISVNDTELTDSKIITVFVLDARDVDNDGNPDFNETDDDNDNIPDEDDFLTGNLSSINTTLLLNIAINGTSNLSKLFNGTFTVNITNGSDALIEFNFTFNYSNTLDFGNLTINKTTNGSSAISIRGDISLFGSTKTLFLQKINATAKAVCIKDDNIGFDAISPSCDSANETLVLCDNSAIGQYACFDTGLSYRVTGLRHSAVKEQCRDVDGDGYGAGCAAGNDCDDNDSTKTASCSNPSPAPSNSGASSSGGGGGVICIDNWQCGEWSQCIDGVKNRACIEKNQCAFPSNKPVDSIQCSIEVKNEQLASSVQATDYEYKELKETNQPSGNFAGITGQTVKSQLIKKSGFAVFVILIGLLVIVGIYFVIRKRHIGS